MKRFVIMRNGTDTGEVFAKNEIEAMNEVIAWYGKESGFEVHEVDSFVWNIVSKEKAIELFESGKEVFKLYSDGSEALVEDELDFLDSEVTYGVEIK